MLVALETRCMFPGRSRPQSLRLYQLWMRRVPTSMSSMFHDYLASPSTPAPDIVPAV